MKQMKKWAIALLLLVLSTTPFSRKIFAQKQLSRESFQLYKAPVKQSFTAFTRQDFAKNSKDKSDADLITLPNGKKVTLAAYLKSINYVEKNLSDLGFSKDRSEKLIVLSKFKAPTADLTSAATLSARPLLTKTSLASRFTIASKTVTLKPVTASIIDRTKLPLNADKLPNETISRSENFNIPQFKVAGYGVKIDASFSMNGTVDPFSLLDRQINQDSLNKLVAATANEYSLGFNVTIGADLPQIGNFAVYSIQSNFSTKASGSIKSKAKLKVMDQVLIDEDRTVNNNKYHFVQNQVFNTSKLLAAADIFMYGLNFVSPVDFYLSSNGVGADFDVTMTKTGVQGTAGPTITQSVFMESSVTELLGPGGEFVNSDVLDAGVGGELRLVEGGFDFGGNIGLAVENGSLKLKNDVYKAVDVKLLRGRLYTYYSYPKYVCDNIFGALDPNCWIVRRIENNLFDSGSAIRYQKVLFDDNKDVVLNW